MAQRVEALRVYVVVKAPMYCAHTHMLCKAIKIPCGCVSVIALLLMMKCVYVCECVFVEKWLLQSFLQHDFCDTVCTCDQEVNVKTKVHIQKSQTFMTTLLACSCHPTRA